MARKNFNKLTLVDNKRELSIASLALMIDQAHEVQCGLVTENLKTDNQDQDFGGPLLISKYFKSSDY